MMLHPVPDTPPRAVLYLRQSIHRDDSISIELQEIAGRDYCARMGYVVSAVEADEGLSGRRWDNRPAVARVMSMIEAKEADVIILWKWSRLSRNRRDWALAADRVEVAGGRIESATEPVDVATSVGRLARGVLTEFAAFESERIGEQWEEVRQRRLKKGMPAAGRLPWGWERRDDGIHPHPEHGPIVVEMYRRYLEGNGAAGIARWLNGQAIPAPNGGLWTKARPLTVMDSPIHAGFIPYRGGMHPGAHQPLIDADTWADYRAMRAERHQEQRKPRTSAYMLAGLVHCHCGRRMNGKGAITGGKWYGGYMCYSPDPEHGPRYISAIAINEHLQGWLAKLAKPVTEAASKVQVIETTTDVERLSREYQALEKQLVTLTGHLVSGLVPEAAYQATRDDITARQQVLKGELDAVERRRPADPPPDTAFVRDLIRDWDELANDDRRAMINRMLGRVTVDRDGSTVFKGRWELSSE